jgi:L-fuconolactonase
MRLVDSHTHAWGPDTADLPWYSADLPPGWSGPYPHGDLRADMEETHVDEGLLLPTTIYGRHPRANEYTLRAIEAHPDRLWGVGVAEYQTDETALREHVRRVLGHDRMLGLRFHACFEYGPTPGDLDPTAEWIAADGMDPLYDELGEHDGAAFVLAKPEQLSMLASLADRFPDVDFVVEHMAFLEEQIDPADRPWTDFATLAEHDNAFVKLSSIPRASAEAWPYADVEPYVQSLLEWFGPERLLLGSDYPWLDATATYEECLTWPEEAEYLSARDCAFLSHRSFDRLRGDA